MKLINVNKGKVHISKDAADQSLCGQAPWTHPVENFNGTFEEVTCERCIKKEKASSGQLNTFSRA